MASLGLTFEDDPLALSALFDGLFGFREDVEAAVVEGSVVVSSSVVGGELAKGFPSEIKKRELPRLLSTNRSFSSFANSSKCEL